MVIADLRRLLARVQQRLRVSQANYDAVFQDRDNIARNRHNLQQYAAGLGDENQRLRTRVRNLEGQVLWFNQDGSDSEEQDSDGSSSPRNTPPADSSDDASSSDSDSQPPPPNRRGGRNVRTVNAVVPSPPPPRGTYTDFSAAAARPARRMNTRLQVRDNDRSPPPRLFSRERARDAEQARTQRRSAGKQAGVSKARRKTRGRK